MLMVAIVITLYILIGVLWAVFFMLTDNEDWALVGGAWPIGALVLVVVGVFILLPEYLVRLIQKGRKSWGTTE